MSLEGFFYLFLLLAIYAFGVWLTLYSIGVILRWFRDNFLR
jgi:hypothetical protein